MLIVQRGGQCRSALPAEHRRGHRRSAPGSDIFLDDISVSRRMRPSPDGRRASWSRTGQPERPMSSRDTGRRGTVRHGDEVQIGKFRWYTSPDRRGASSSTAAERHGKPCQSPLSGRKPAARSGAERAPRRLPEVSIPRSGFGVRGVWSARAGAIGISPLHRERNRAAALHLVGAA